MAEGFTAMAPIAGDRHDDAALEAALRRNLYGTLRAPHPTAAMAVYIRAAQLAGQPLGCRRHIARRPRPAPIRDPT
jgi:hypothetical protein